MLFRIEKNKDQDNWEIIPASGALQGIRIGSADAVSIESASFDSGAIIGCIQALWGLSIENDLVYSDIETLRSLRINKAFHMLGENQVELTQEGAFDSLTGRKVTRAKHAVAFGPCVYRKG